MDPAGAHRFPDCGFRQCLPDCAGCVVPDYHAHQQRHRFIPNSYFEVSSTLGAGSFYRIAKVGIPAAMPHMFLGLFNGTCSSFITLVTAEMLGAKYGIGWYINWQKEMMAYANVYAGLIIIAVTFFILITLLFKFRDRVLAWQKGVIKW